MDYTEVSEKGNKIMCVDELKDKLDELNTYWYVKSDDSYDLHIKANKNQRTYMTVMHNKDSAGDIKSYTIQVNLCSVNGFEPRNYFRPEVKIKNNTLLSYLTRYVEYMGSINKYLGADRYGMTVWC